MASHNLAHLKIDDLEIMGYSVAGEETVVGMPQLDVCFDIGKAPDQVISINNVLITHGHIDHAAGIAYYLSHRNFNGQSPGTVLAPAHLIPPIKQILDVWGKIDGNPVPGNLVGVQPGDEYQVKPNLFVKAFPTKHQRGSVGYAVIERRKKLRIEYAGLTGPQIVELKKQGVDIEYHLDIPIVSYLGDTQYVDFSQLDYVAKSKILISECTFYELEHVERAEAGKHIHINEFADLAARMANEHIVIIHTTHRTPLKDVQTILKNSLPPEIYDKTILLMGRKSRK